VTKLLLGATVALVIGPSAFAQAPDPVRPISTLPADVVTVATYY
jgi:hypothetical protein